MGRWQQLPGGLPPQAARLVEELRLYKDRAGLSLASLAVKTAYSTTSWHRYLNGRKLPPWRAVELLGQLAEADRGRLRVLWESAAIAWQDGTGERGETAGGEVLPAGPAAGALTQSAGGSGGFRQAVATVVSRRTVIAGAVLGAGALFVVLALIQQWTGGTGGAAVPRGAPPGAPTWPWPLRSLEATSAGVGCRGRGCQGRDPYREGCDRFSTVVHTLRAYGTVLILRHSLPCHAVWAEAEPARGTERLLVTAQGAVPQQARPGSSRTAMTVAAPAGALACLVIANRHQLCVTEHDSWVEPVGQRRQRARVTASVRTPWKRPASYTS
ncbi:helix-turn-helix domain-containing protein [Streptomyces sp. NPDC006012]|uniref:helix-turn-helix domain-containing protein n=1 Tax=Streptomyces sp. NPDC006012 TaxID=3364739 RepID=UPI00368D94F6